MTTDSNPTKIPAHVSIIMDGNGRWAKKKHLPTIAGHRAGAATARAITEHAAKMGIQYLTLYTFSSENWLRDKAWINDFMGLLRWYLGSEIKDIMAQGVRVRVIGDRTLFPEDIQTLIAETEIKTQHNTTITVILALSYGGRDEILRAVRTLATKAQRGEIAPEAIDIATLEGVLDTASMPHPDLLIRTSGEQRISNFLLWQMAYTEFVFVPELWPDFTPEIFEQAINDYQHRKRRYGTD